MATTSDGRGSGVVESEAVERYDVDGVTYGVHPAARLFPRLESREFDELFHDIVVNGLRQPVFVRGREIVDGRNRLRAALRAGVTIRFKEIGGDVDVYKFVASANLYRRNLTTSQRAVIAVRLVQLSARAELSYALRKATETANRPSDADGGPTAAASGDPAVSRMTQLPPSADGGPVAQPKPAPDTQSASGQHARSDKSASSSGQLSLFPPAPSQEAQRHRHPSDSDVLTQKKAADALGIGRRTVARAAGVVKDAPDLEQLVLDGTLKLGAAEAIRKLPEEERTQAIEAVKSRKSRTAKRAVRPPKAQAPTGESPAEDTPRAPCTSADQGPSGPSPSSATAVARNGKRASSVPEEIFSPPAVLKAVRLALGNIDLDPCSSETAQKEVQATAWYGAGKDGLKRPWKGAVHVFPPLDRVPAFALKLLDELDGGGVPQAALLAPLDLTDSWLDRVLAHDRLRVVVIENGRRQYGLGGPADTWTPACRMALCLFGINEPAAGLLTEFGRWGHVLLANGYAGAPGHGVDFTAVAANRSAPSGCVHQRPGR